jgi:hypothetical protein
MRNKKVVETHQKLKLRRNEAFFISKAYKIKIIKGFTHLETQFPDFNKEPWSSKVVLRLIKQI